MALIILKALGRSGANHQVRQLLTTIERSVKCLNFRHLIARSNSFILFFHSSFHFETDLVGHCISIFSKGKIVLRIYNESILVLKDTLFLFKRNVSPPRTPLTTLSNTTFYSQRNKGLLIPICIPAQGFDNGLCYSSCQYALSRQVRQQLREELSHSRHLFPLIVDQAIREDAAQQLECFARHTYVS